MRGRLGLRRLRCLPKRKGIAGFAIALAALSWPPAGRLSAQELADYDYENLSFRGLGVSAGVIYPNKLERAVSYNVRVDMGFLGPQFRLVPHLSYWRSDFNRDELSDLELRLRDLIRRSQEGPAPEVDLGVLTWSDLAVAADAEYVSPWGAHVESFAGTGIAFHLMRGSGEAIRDTFVEDLLNRLTPGLNVHAGLAALVAGLRVSVQARWEIMDDLSYFDFRAGLGYAFGGRGGE